MDERKRGRAISIALAVVIAAVGLWTFHDLPIRHEITEFMPTEDRESARVAREVFDSELGRTMVLAIGADGEGEAIEAARQIAARLREVDGIAWVRSGPPDGIEEAFYRLYFARRYAFFAESEDAARARLTDESLAAAAQRLRSELSGPTGMLVRRVAPEDPLLAFADHVRSLQHGGGGPRVIDGQLVADDGFALVFAATDASTFSTAITGPLLDRVDAILEETNDAHGGSLRFEQSSIHRFALVAERAIRTDVQRISTLSTLGVVVLFVLLYRGPRYLLLGAIPLAAGTVLATAACRLVFGGIHGITFAFGSSLLGVGIDYIAHYVNHHVLEPDPKGPEETMRKLWPGLALGAGTTIAGLAGLAWTSFPGMREMALFAAVGVTAALLTTRVMVPPWMPDAAPAPRITRALADGARRLWDAMQRRRAPFLALPIAALAVALIGIPRLVWVDDIRALNDADPALLAEDRAVRQRVAQGESGRFVIARGASDEEALARNDEAFAGLERARAHGAIASFRSVHPMLRSAALQDRVQHAVIESPELADRMIAALDAAGFVGSMFEPFRASLHASSPLAWAELEESPAIDLVRPFRVEIPDGVAYLTFVDGVDDPAALREELAAMEGVAYFDQSEFLIDAYRTFRTRTIELLVLGLLVVAGMCIARYRSLRLGLASVGPAALAAAASLGALGLVGEPANLMHLVGALLVLSMGEDFAVFLLEARADPRGVATTMVGIAVACATTVLSFGLLATSSHPAMRALGVMVSMGVALSLLMAPLALLFGDTLPTRKPLNS